MSDETLYPIILNSSNLVQGSNGNSTYRYQFPAGSVKFKNSKVAVASLSMYYSWYNITSGNGNNSFQIIWPIGAGRLPSQ